MDAKLAVEIIVGLVVVWLAFIVVLWFFRPKDVPLRELLVLVPDVLRLVRDLIADRRTPLGPRLALVGLLAWLISPIDLIPEFIPVLGPLDDAVVAVIVLRYVGRRVGRDELRARWRGTDAGFRLLAAVVR
jgi:uncharacterized membrane protein YkvA (DUF1232 family)